MKYRYLDHTSDLGMEIFGRDLPDLFRNACFAVFDNIVGTGGDATLISSGEARQRLLPSGRNGGSVPSRSCETIRIEISSDTPEELFLDWLRELLFRFSTQYFVVREVSSIAIVGTRLSAELKGEKFDPARHRVKIEIKTPTYHMYRIEQSAEGYMATIIFDV